MELLIVTSLVGALVWAILRPGDAPKQRVPVPRDRSSRPQRHASEPLDAPADVVALSGVLTNDGHEEDWMRCTRDVTEYSARPTTGSGRTVRSSTRLFTGAEEDEAAEAVRRALRK